MEPQIGEILRTSNLGVNGFLKKRNSVLPSLRENEATTTSPYYHASGRHDGQIDK